jgi:hypothetical protein
MAKNSLIGGSIWEEYSQKVQDLMNHPSNYFLPFFILLIFNISFKALKKCVGFLPKKTQC